MRHMMTSSNNQTIMPDAGLHTFSSSADILQGYLLRAYVRSASSQAEVLPPSNRNGAVVVL